MNFWQICDQAPKRPVRDNAFQHVPERMRAIKIAEQEPRQGNNTLDSNNTCDVLSETDMAWSEPQYSGREVNAAGVTLAGENPERDWVHAMEVVDNWRSSHSFPLNTFQMHLRRKVAEVDTQGIVAQRIKRLSSLLSKLRRFPSMRLSEMQDIGGCRAIVHDVAQVDQLVNTYEFSSRIRHKLVHRDDYIRSPRDSGYRSRHLIYCYESDRSETFNGLKIEMQFRSSLQHYWATAVETIDAFTQQALKSSQGERDWEQFFRLMGTVMAFREGTPEVASFV